MQNPRKKRSPIILIIIVLILLIVGGGYFYWQNLNAPVSSEGEIRAFVIKRGESMDSVATRLEEDGLIKSANVFKLKLKLSGKGETIQAGDFKISPRMSVGEIIENFSKGSIDKWVTVIEGWRVEEVAKKLNEEIGINQVEFLEAAEEGYMFPDTYLFHPEAKAADIASTMKNTFNLRYSKELQSKIKALGLTPEEGVILASIVEREGRSDQVRQEVASIMLKRFNIGMKLDADATVQYAKDSQALRENGGSIDKFWKPILRVDYTEVISPFNTYLNPGLPPAPICNPSLSSLQAVADADPNTPYLFYYHDSSGNSHLARTLEEHNQNVSTYP